MTNPTEPISPGRSILAMNASVHDVNRMELSPPTISNANSTDLSITNRDTITDSESTIKITLFDLPAEYVTTLSKAITAANVMHKRPVK